MNDLLSVYHIERVGDTGYDEVVEMCVVARDRKSAIKLASCQDWGDWNFDESCIKATKVNLKKRTGNYV